MSRAIEPAPMFDGCRTGGALVDIPIRWPRVIRHLVRVSVRWILARPIDPRNTSRVENRERLLALAIASLLPLAVAGWSDDR